MNATVSPASDSYGNQSVTRVAATGFDVATPIRRMPGWGEPDSSTRVLPEKYFFSIPNMVNDTLKPPVTFSTEKLHGLDNWEYIDLEEKRGKQPSPPLEDFVKDTTLRELFDFLSSAPDEVLQAQVALARKQGANFSSRDSGASPRPADAPPLWAERKTGREVSPVDWIKMHYGRTLEDGSWDPMGLSRKTISNLDHPLYQALATWLVRHPDDAFDTPPARRPRAKTPDEALARRVQVSREAQARFRQKHL